MANQLVIITGISGSGKSTALNAFEDIGFFCVENLPSPLIANFVNFLKDLPEQWKGAGRKAAGKTSWRFALLVDCRDEESFPHLQGAMETLRTRGVEVRLLFLECQDEVVVRRFRETRRPHPLMLLEPSLTSVEDAIKRERELLSELRDVADRVIDSTAFSPHDLRRAVEVLFEHETALEIAVTSFGFKYGVPHDADVVMDVRFLPNPHFVSELQPLTGNDEKVAEFVFKNGDAQEFLERYLAILGFLVPRYKNEGKRYLVIAVGCTGGKHRSVALANTLAASLQNQGLRTTVRHRDIGRL